MTISSKAPVEVTAERIAMRRLLTREPQAVAKHDLAEWKIQRVTRAAITICESNRACRKGGANARPQTEEVAEAANNNPVESGAEADRVITTHDACVVFKLLVVLEC